MDGLPQHNLFSDPEQARLALGALADLADTDFAETVGRAALDTGDPLRALVGMTRFVERCLSPKMEAALAMASPRPSRRDADQQATAQEQQI